MGKDGLKATCKKCRKTYEIKNKDTRREYNKKWIENNSEHKKSYDRQYRIDNIEKKLAYDSEYRMKNNKEVRVRAKRWKDNNPDRTNQYSINRRARLNNAIVGKISPLAELLAGQQHKCANCGDFGDGVPLAYRSHHSS